VLGALIFVVVLIEKDLASARRQSRSKEKLRTKNQEQISNLRSKTSVRKMHSDLVCVKKVMKAERCASEDTLRGTLLLRMATLGLSQSNGVVIQKAPCLHLSM
jgi:hypothetical protein